jgi:hypothetical protein
MNEVFQGVQALTAVLTVGLLIYNVVIGRKTHALVNGQSEILKTAAYAKGASDSKQDARDAAEVARNLSADKAITEKRNGGNH